MSAKKYFISKEENKARKKQMNLDRIASDPEAHRKKMAAYREKNRERIRNHDRKNASKYAEKKNIYRKKWAEKNKEVLKIKGKISREKNRDKMKEYLRQYYINNKERFREYYLIKYQINRKEILDRRLENRDLYIEKCRLWKLNNKDKLIKYTRKNQHRSNSNTSKYRARKKKALPKWLTLEDFEKINQIYNECSLRNRESIVKYSVDHFYPLTSDWVCGLHCPLNLRIITASDNSSKRNRRTEEHYVE